jgi:hypothetical protein
LISYREMMKSAWAMNCDYEWLYRYRSVMDEKSCDWSMGDSYRWIQV